MNVIPIKILEKKKEKKNVGLNPNIVFKLLKKMTFFLKVTNLKKLLSRVC